MAEETVVRHLPVNPCCELWKEKLTKLQQRLTKSDNYRAALKQGIGICEKQIAKIEAENLNLKKVCEEERAQANNEREEKVKESALRVSLENEISSLKSELSSLKQKGSSGTEDLGEEVITLRARLSESEQENHQLKEHLKKEQTRADDAVKKALEESKKAIEACKTAEAEINNAKKLQADNEKEMKVKESAIRLPLETEISSLKSQITLLQEEAVSGALQVDNEVTLLKARVSEGYKEIHRLKELLQKEKLIADSEKKKFEEERKKLDEERRKADMERSRAEKMYADNEREEKAKELSIRVALADEISALKSQTSSLQQQISLSASDVDNEVTLLKARVSKRDLEINQLKELLEKEKTIADSEKKKVDVEMKKCNEMSNKKKENKSKQLSSENEISALKSQIFLLQQGTGVGNVDKELSIFRAQVSEREAEIKNIKELLEKERTREESEKKKAEAGKEKANEAQKNAKAEKSRADEEKRLAAIERKKGEEIRLQLERLRVEADDLRANLTSESLKFQQTNKMLETERQNVMNEKKRADLEMTKAEEQRKLSEINTRKFVLEKSRADCLSQQLEEDRQKLKKVQEEIAEQVSSKKLVEAPGDLSVTCMNLETVKFKGEPNRESGASKLVSSCLMCEKVNKKLKDVNQKVKREKKRADSEMIKVEEQRKVAEACEKKAIMEKNRAEQLTLELEDSRRRTEELKKEIQELISSRALVDPFVNKHMSTDAIKMKLLKKELKLEKIQVKHAKQVASLEKSRNVLLQQEIWRMKEKFSQISGHFETLDKCFSHQDNVCKSRVLNLKRKSLDEDQYQMQLHSGSELLKPSGTTLEASATFVHDTKLNAQLLSFGRDCSESISGINSKLEPLVRGSKRTLLKSSSAINSSMASFSDSPLVGSQERRAMSAAELDNLAEGKSKSQPANPRLSDDVMKSICTRNIAVVAENSVRVPQRIDACGQNDLHYKKRKRILSVESPENLYCQGKKSKQKTTENLSTLQDMSKNPTERQLGEGRDLLPDLEGDDHKKKYEGSEEEVAVQHSHITNELNKKLGCKDIGETHVYPNDYQPVNNETGIAHVCNENIGDARMNNSGSFELVVEGDYMKLLCLDDNLDEENFRVAIERPLSPTLPEIAFRSRRTSRNGNSKGFDGLLSTDDDNVVSCSPNVKIDSNKLNASTSSTCQVPLFQEKVSVGDSNEILENDKNCKSQKGLNISSEGNYVSACDDISCVLFSNTNDSTSISKILSATRICMAQCSLISKTDRLVQVTLCALLKTEGLLPKEKVCVFFSLLLQNCPEFAMENFKNLMRDGLIPFFDSFAGQMHSAMDDPLTRSMFEELLNLDELLNLLEDFLLDRLVLVHSSAFSESTVSDPRADILQSRGNTILSFQEASPKQLVFAAIVLVSICAEIDSFGFVCEVSYRIFRRRDIDPSLLAILHIFAYTCGAKYINNNEYSLLVTVLKSLITSLERAMLPTYINIDGQSLIKVQLGFPPCIECPFSEGAVSMDAVVSLLMENLHDFVLSDVSYEDLMKSIVSFNSRNLESEEKKDPNAGNGEALHIQCSICNAVYCFLEPEVANSSLETASYKTLSHLDDVLLFFELVARNMSWNWTYNNIVLQLLKFLESCISEKLWSAIVILLGHLGRLGVDANGYHDAGVEILRGRLSAFLCQSASSNMDLPSQIATVTALLGVISLSFEELINSDKEHPKVASDPSPIDCIRKWFSLLTNEQQSLSSEILIGFPSRRTDSFE